MIMFVDNCFRKAIAEAIKHLKIRKQNVEVAD